MNTDRVGGAQSGAAGGHRVGENRADGGPSTFCDAPADYIVETYFVLRMVIAGGAIVLPPALLVWALLDWRVAMMDSLSAFYFTPARSLFVSPRPTRSAISDSRRVSFTPDVAAPLR